MEARKENPIRKLPHRNRKDLEHADGKGMSEVLIKADGLAKTFDDLVAVDNISFRVFRGECCGFLGPNGAGKTTTIRMIYCVSPPTSGVLTVAGMNVKDRPGRSRR